MLNPRAANQTLVMTRYFGGNLLLAEGMGPEPDCVTIMGDKEPSLMTEIHVCQGCLLGGPIDLAVLLEKARAEDDAALHAEHG